jgi:hypothetical protein
MHPPTWAELMASARQAEMDLRNAFALCPFCMTLRVDVLGYELAVTL